MTMHTWHWQVHHHLPYLTCSLLSDWQHGFFTQQFAPRTPFEITEAVYPQARAYRVKQVHGNRVLSPSEMPAPLTQNNLLDADGVISEQAQQAVWVCSADCTPVLIADGATGQVAAVHAGWRGTAQKIVGAAIARLQTQGSQLQDLRVALGPAISGEVYQVGWDVAIATASTVVPQVEPLSPDVAIQMLQDHPESGVLPDPETGKARLDVRRVIAAQLEQLGLSPEQVAIAPHCTYRDPVNFFSYRREKLKKAQWSGIVSS
jgi:YfiH family protein